MLGAWLFDWSCAYSDYNPLDNEGLLFHMIPEDDLEHRQSRLLDVDNRYCVDACHGACSGL